VEVLDPARVESRGYAQPDPELRKVPDQAEIQKVIDSRNDPSRDMFVDPQALEQFKKDVLNDSQVKLDPVKEVDAVIEDLRQEIQNLESQGLLDPELKAEAEHILQMDQMHEDEMLVMKAALYCVRR
jgi:hypothetical protein